MRHANESVAPSTNVTAPNVPEVQVALPVISVPSVTLPVHVTVPPLPVRVTVPPLPVTSVVHGLLGA
jgi:hypothetical protein